jgi:tetratricopeptide (TPR) repeat protein
MPFWSPPKKSSAKINLAEALGAEDGLRSPLAGKGLIRALVIIGIAIALPGGLYVLLAMIIAPNIARHFLKRSEHHLTQNQLDAAIEDMTRAVRVSRRSPHTLERRAVLYLQKGDLSAALVDAEAALKKYPGSLEAARVREAALALQNPPAAHRQKSPARRR